MPRMRPEIIAFETAFLTALLMRKNCIFLRVFLRVSVFSLKSVGSL